MVYTILCSPTKREKLPNLKTVSNILYNEAHNGYYFLFGNDKELFLQHVILCSGVEVLEDGVVTKDYPLAKLLQ